LQALKLYFDDEEEELHWPLGGKRKFSFIYKYYYLDKLLKKN
jgi:hypothetical protein